MTEIVDPEQHRDWNWWYLLLLIPFVAVLWVPFYNTHDPVVLGFPFFYWYQLAWVPITSLLIWLAYRGVKHED